MLPSLRAPPTDAAPERPMPPPLPRLPLGTSDFREIRRQRWYYVDKTALVADVLDNSNKVLLLPRPRRFGKTLNLSTLRYFLELPQPDEGEAVAARAARAALFEGLHIASRADLCDAHLAAHPVLFLTFKDVKAANWADCRAGIAATIAAEASRISATLEPHLGADDRERLQALRARTADNADLSKAFLHLSQCLHRATGRQVAILIDEYDTPLHSAFEHGYHDEAIDLIRNLLSGGLKDNTALYKGVLTGILRVAKESVFSGLNNPGVFTLLHTPFSTAFGFTQAEVEALLHAADRYADLPELERWYNGYRFGGQVIYNPWSVLSYLNNPVDGFAPYWVNTASDALLRQLLVQRASAELPDLEALLRGETVEKLVDEAVSLRTVYADPGAVWAFLLHCGYLRADSATPERRYWRATLRVPNREVASALQGLFETALAAGVGGSSGVEHLCQALLGGDARTVQHTLGELLALTLSYHDLGRGRKPEVVYQAFVAGLLVAMDRTHEVRSNRESGFGRVDVLVRPRKAGANGVVMELKVVDTEMDETAEQAMLAAKAQLIERDYAAEVRAAGAAVVRQYAVVFDGKRCRVEVVGA